MAAFPQPTAQNGIGNEIGDHNTSVHIKPASKIILSYEFPRYKLKRGLQNPSKIPLVLVACGSFSPITLLHLRMFNVAADYARLNSDYEVVGGYLSPVGDAYKKAGLAPAKHRLAMCDLAVAMPSNWIMVDHWEGLHDEYLPTAQVLDHFDEELNRDGGIKCPTGGRKPITCALLAGSDLLATMAIPGVWADADLDHILGHHGAWIIERTGTDIDDSLEALKKYRSKIRVVDQLVQNDVSSTKVRMLIKRDMSIQYLVPDPIIPYIKDHSLYLQGGGSSPTLGRSKLEREIDVQ